MSSYKLSPGDIIPEDFSVYIQTEKSVTDIPVVKEKFDNVSSEMGIPKFFKERTNNITAVFFKDNWGYIVAEGKYPDSLIKKNLDEREEWQEGSYKRVKYYFSDNAKTIIIPLKNNTIIVSHAPDNHAANLRAKKIIDIIILNETVIYPKIDNSIFHITSNNANTIFASFVTGSVNFDNIKEINFDIILDSADKTKGGINISFIAEDEKKAILFNSVIRLFISDYVVKKKIVDLKTLKENNSIYHSGYSIYVNIPDIPIEKLNTFIADFVIGEGELN